MSRQRKLLWIEDLLAWERCILQGFELIIDHLKFPQPQSILGGVSAFFHLSTHTVILKLLSISPKAGSAWGIAVPLTGVTCENQMGESRSQHLEMLRC